MTVQFQWSIIVRIGMQKLAVTQLRHVTSVNASTITFYSPSDSAVAAMLSPASALKCCYASALAAISSVNVSATVCFDSCLAARPLGVAALQTDAPDICQQYLPSLPVTLPRQSIVFGHLCF